MRKESLAKAATIANLILIGIGTCCFVIVGYVFYRHTWSGQGKFSWVGLILYYALPTLVGGLAFACLRLQANLKINIALILCSAVISLYAVEGVTEIWSKLPSVKDSEWRRALAREAKAKNIEFDTRTG